MMATSPLGSTSPWPTISEAHELENDHETHEESWEILSGEGPSAVHITSTKLLKHAESSPNSGTIYFEEEEESFTEVDQDLDGKSVNTAVTDFSHVLVDNPPSPTVSSPPVGGGLVKVHRVPSFKDAILLNAQEKQKEKLEKEKKEQELTNKLKQTRRKIGKPRYVVKEIKRCSRSTPDLHSLAKVEEDEDYYGGGGGGGGEILGETDAADFYARKNQGAISRKNGTKLRPDEAKRKEFIIFKKEAQRKSQR